jgi:hypothetical protein
MARPRRAATTADDAHPLQRRPHPRDLLGRARRLPGGPRGGPGPWPSIHAWIRWTSSRRRWPPAMRDRRMSSTPTRMPTTFFRASAISLSGPAPPWSRMRRRSSGGRPGGSRAAEPSSWHQDRQDPPRSRPHARLGGDPRRRPPIHGRCPVRRRCRANRLHGWSASDLFDTFRTFEALPDTTVVHPGHDYVGRAVSTIGEEKAQDPLMRERDRTVFVSRSPSDSASCQHCGDHPPQPG